MRYLPVGPSSESTTSPTTAGAAEASAPSPSYSRRPTAHTISDDDDASTLQMRENQIIQALREAATAAGACLTTPASTQMTPAPAAQEPHPQQVSPATKNTQARLLGGGGTKETFPMRLHAILADPTVCDVCSWLPHGKSFVVLRPDVFAAHVLPRYFAPDGSNSLTAKAKTNKKSTTQGVHKYPSFTRKLNRWGFRQSSRGPDAGAFCHELFQRDYRELCRGMVCQKSRKPKTPMFGQGGMMDDMMSVSSASTMGTKSTVASGEKRPYSSTVTVSTAGAISNRNLPLKKRKSFDSTYLNDIPSMISHRNRKMPAYTSSVTETDVTSENGSSCSSSNGNAPAVTAAVSNPSHLAEAVAREALARHFHEQHRAFALASLKENSRMAMEMAGMKNQACTSTAAAKATADSASAQLSPASVGSPQELSQALGVTTHSPAVFAPTVSVSEEKTPSADAISTAEAAKNALYLAFLQAVSST